MPMITKPMGELTLGPPIFLTMRPIRYAAIVRPHPIRLTERMMRSAASIFRTTTLPLASRREYLANNVSVH